jgi:peptidoglycan-associated lipoprotein
MAPRRSSVLSVLPLLALSVLLMGCPKRPATTSTAAPPPPAPSPAAVAPAPAPSTSSTTDTSPTPPSAPAPSPPSPSSPSPATPPRPSEFRAVDALKDIFFDFDKYNIRPGDVRVLDANAAWLKENQNQLVLIEGHCDERGTSEYNLALGERRAKAAMGYLVSQGVQANRITIISYGEERPSCNEHNEACWAKNRRAHFLVKAR